MGYTLEDNEIGLILKPLGINAKGQWKGVLATGLAVDKSCTLKEPVLTELINIAATLAAFLHEIQSDPKLLEFIEHRRDHLMDELMENISEETNGLPEVEVKSSDGKVIKLNAWTKTKGSA